MHCLVLAGGVPRPGEALNEETRGGPKALLDLAGRPMVQWVLDALAASGRIDGVVLAGLDGGGGEELAFDGDLDLVPQCGPLAANLFAGIQRLLELAPGRRAVYCWSDIPLATGEMMRRFLDRADGVDADVVAGLVARAALEDRFCKLEELWLKLADGPFLAADFGVFDPSRAEPVRDPLGVLTTRRKSAISQARTVGLGVLIRYLLGRLDRSALERVLLRRYGIRARILVVDDPELALDVDGLASLAICRRELGERRSPA